MSDLFNFHILERAKGHCHKFGRLHYLHTVPVCNIWLQNALLSTNY